MWGLRADWAVQAGAPRSAMSQPPDTLHAAAEDRSAMIGGETERPREGDRIHEADDERRGNQGRPASLRNTPTWRSQQLPCLHG